MLTYKNEGSGFRAHIYNNFVLLASDETLKGETCYNKHLNLANNRSTGGLGGLGGAGIFVFVYSHGAPLRNHRIKKLQ
jgi:hypothetical protein